MFRFVLAFVIGKLAKFALTVLHRRGTQLPGDLAWRICPDFLKYINKPKNILCITGTNGKTTCSNLIEDSLRQLGYSFVDNSFGSNTTSGICGVMLNSVNIFNQEKYDWAILEVDERSSVHIYKYIVPNYLLCTNLFRDSIARNAHTEFIFNILNSTIPKETTLILNGDDVISSRLGGTSNKKVYFGIEPQPFEKEETNIVNDGKTCPNCGNLMNFNFRRYHHIGRAECPVCGLSSPSIDINCTKIDTKTNSILVNTSGKETKLPLINPQIFNVYNEVAVVAALSTIGVSTKSILDCIKNLSIVDTRFREETIEGVHVTYNMSKGQNPVATSRSLHLAQNAPGTKQVLLLIGYMDVQSSGPENICWFYESDFEALNDPSIEHIYIAGLRHLDLRLRLQLAGVAPDKITDSQSIKEVLSQVKRRNSTEMIVLSDIEMDEVCKNIVSPAFHEKLKSGGDDSK